MKNFVVILLTTLLSASSPHVFAYEPEQIKDGQRVPNDKSQAATVRGDPKAIAKLIDDINAAVRTNKQRMLSIIVINTDVAGSTLEREKTETGMTFGDVYVAHSLALATKKKFSAIVALHKSGKTWADIAKTHGVTLKGSSELIKEMQKQG